MMLCFARMPSRRLNAGRIANKPFPSRGDSFPDEGQGGRQMNPKRADILIVDDDEVTCEVLSRQLTMLGYKAKAVSTAEAAMELLEKETFALALVDIMMPGLSGIDLLAFIKSRLPEIAVLMVTGLDDVKTALMTVDMGAYGYLIKPVKTTELAVSIASALERQRNILETKEHEQTISEQVQKQCDAVSRVGEDMVTRMLTTARMGPGETLNHARRLGESSALLARYLLWPEQEVENLRLAAQLHDIGQSALPDSLLWKTERLSVEEEEIMRTHTIKGARILEGSSVPFLRMARDVALHHHEKWDGTGYPHRLRGDTIPASARIVAIVDAFDRLTHNRLHLRAISPERAVVIMREYRGIVFDPRIFDYFLTLLPRIRTIQRTFPEDGCTIAAAC